MMHQAACVSSHHQHQQEYSLWPDTQDMYTLMIGHHPPPSVAAEAADDIMEDVTLILLLNIIDFQKQSQYCCTDWEVSGADSSYRYIQAASARAYSAVQQQGGLFPASHQSPNNSHINKSRMRPREAVDDVCYDCVVPVRAKLSDHNIWNMCGLHTSYAVYRASDLFHNYQHRYIALSYITTYVGASLVLGTTWSSLFYATGVAQTQHPSVAMWQCGTRLSAPRRAPQTTYIYIYQSSCC